MNCIIVADDLTGACDSALQFRKRGAHTLVHVQWSAPPRQWAEIDAFSTDSRDLDSREADTRIRTIARHAIDASAPATLIFKKIDSLLRGSPGREIATTLDAFGCDVGIVAPAFPEMGRIVCDGYLHVPGNCEWKPVNILELLRLQGLEDCRHVSPGRIKEALQHGAKYISVDSASSEDLRAIVAEAMRCGRRVLWAGSAGLASGLADALFPERGGRICRPRGTRPVLFCIGSQHPVTIAQLRAFSRERIACEFSASAASQAGIAEALVSGKHVILRVDTDATATIRGVISWAGALMEAVVISGGDTVALFCRATGCEIIEIENQILDGIPWGMLRGGLVNNLAVATKSGAFGAPDALTKVTDFFTCPRN